MPSIATKCTAASTNSDVDTNDRLTVEQLAEIQSARSQLSQTRRASVPALEEILLEPIPVLDRGFIRVVDYMGDDSAIVQAARVSYGKGTKQITKDRGLIQYLLRHRHSTPFEMCEIKFHVKLPIFVARQWIRHRTANVNEYSARYSILDNEFYVPDSAFLEESLLATKAERRVARELNKGKQPDMFGVGALDLQPEATATQSATNKQGRGQVLSEALVTDIARLIRKHGDRSYKLYQQLLNEREDGEIIDASREGVARELARTVLPVNCYTQWYWKVDLHNLMHFLSLRADPHAQYEIRVYAEAMVDVLKRWVPLTAEAFEEYRLHATSLSRSGMAVVKRMLAGEAVTQETSGLGKREWRELMEALGREA